MVITFFCLHFKQARVDWVLRIFETQAIKKKGPVKPMFSDYLSVSYDYVLTRSSSIPPENVRKPLPF